MMEYVCPSPAGSSKGKNKVGQEQENPDDLREPSTEEDERRFSTLEYEVPDDDTEDVSDTLNTTGEHSTGQRKLLRIDKRSEFELIQFSLIYPNVNQFLVF